MMDEIMAEYSNKYLIRLFKRVKLTHSIGLMGGWAVHYLLKQKGVEHIGSRDIDIFFDPEKVSFDSVRRLIEKEGFVPHSTFRWAKFIDRLTGRELDGAEAAKVPQYELCVVYVDVAAPRRVNEHVMNEPLLRKAFDGKSALVKLDGVRALVPNEKLMVEMKLGSSRQRSDRFKKSKDIADLFMLLLNDSSLLDAIDKNPRKEFKSSMAEFRASGNIADAASMIGVPMSAILGVLERV